MRTRACVGRGTKIHKNPVVLAAGLLIDRVAATPHGVLTACRGRADGTITSAAAESSVDYTEPVRSAQPLAPNGPQEISVTCRFAAAGRTTPRCTRRASSCSARSGNSGTGSYKHQTQATARTKSHRVSRCESAAVCGEERCGPYAALERAARSSGVRRLMCWGLRAQRWVVVLGG